MKYLNELNIANRAGSSILIHDSSDLRRDSNASDSIFMTWEKSYMHIKRKRASAARGLWVRNKEVTRTDHGIEQGNTASLPLIHADNLLMF